MAPNSEGTNAITRLHLGGEDGLHDTFALPRLLLAETDGTLVRNQIAFARRLKAGFGETVAWGIATQVLDRTRMQGPLVSRARPELELRKQVGEESDQVA